MSSKECGTKEVVELISASIFCKSNDLYPSPNIVRVIKSRRMRWAGHVARVGEVRVCIWSCWGNRKERDHW